MITLGNSHPSQRQQRPSREKKLADLEAELMTMLREAPPFRPVACNVAVAPR